MLKGGSHADESKSTGLSKEKQELAGGWKEEDGEELTVQLNLYSEGLAAGSELFIKIP